MAMKKVATFKRKIGFGAGAPTYSPMPLPKRPGAPTTRPAPVSPPGTPVRAPGKPKPLKKKAK